MPTYQYACTECDEQLEVRQSFTDDALSVCPSCEGRLRKVFNAVGVVFKGSGFYKTDSRKQPAAESGSKDSGSKDSGSGTGKDSAGSGKDAAGSGKDSAAKSGSGSSGGSGDSAKSSAA
ncbi:MAG: FmdB family transcriptional regulator [Actinomycetota bacterium]|nr:FmdB family transcriptional regulator [Actinomycetota bacterium]